MKKLFGVLLCFSILCGSFCVNAKEYVSVELEIQLGSFVAFVGEETVSTEAPFLHNGMTMASVEVLSMAFGNSYEDKIDYNGKVIEFTAGSNIAIINDEEKEMPEAPVRVNGSLMVPVRFVCDVYDALIEYEDETGIIRISKSADFEEIFNRNANGYWCDDDYGWMIKLPDSYVFYDIVYDGSHSRFVNDSSDAAFDIRVKKNSYQNIEQIRSRTLAEGSGDLLRNEEYIKLSDGTKAYYAEFEEYALVKAISGEYFYDVEFYSSDAETFEVYLEEAKEALKTFTFKIDKSVDPKNVSILNEGGYTLFTDKTLGFSVHKMDSWTEPKYIGTNIITWQNKNYALISDLTTDDIFFAEMRMSVFSAEEGDTPQRLAEIDKQAVYDSYNKSFLFDVEVKEAATKELSGAQIDYRLQYNGRKQLNKMKYFIKDDYIYQAEYYVVYSENIPEDTLGLELIEEMFDSIKIIGADKSKLGKVIDISRAMDESVLQSYTNQNKNYSVSLPAQWTTVTYANDVLSANLRGSIELAVQRTEGIKSLEQARNYYLDEYPDVKCKKVNFAGKTAYKADIYEYNNNGEGLLVTAYIFVADGAAYSVATMIKEIYASERNVNQVDNVIRSFKLI